MDQAVIRLTLTAEAPVLYQGTAHVGSKQHQVALTLRSPTVISPMLHSHLFVYQ